MQKMQSIWKAAFSSGGQIKFTSRKNGEKSRSALSSINTTGVATLSYAISSAVIAAANGRCIVGLADGKRSQFCFEILDADKTFVQYKILFDAKDRKIKCCSYENSQAGKILAYVPNLSQFARWVLFLPRLFELLYAQNSEAKSNYLTIKNELAINCELLSVDSDASLFIINDYFYETRHEYALSDDDIEQEDLSAISIKTDMSEIFRTGEAIIDQQDDKGMSADSAKFEDANDYLLVRDDIRDQEKLPLGVRIPDVIKRIAQMVKVEKDSAMPVRNILLYGEAGAGKSTAAKSLAYLWGLPYRFVNLSLNAEEGDLLGSYRPNGMGGFEFFLPSFAKTFMLGGVIELMEINYSRPGVIGVLNSALDHTAKLTLGNGEVVSRHSNCIIIATTNVDYAGCQKMSEAVKDRFHQLVEIQKLPENELVEVVAEQSGNSNKDLILKMVDAADKISTKIREEQITGGVCSVRQIINWARTVKYTDSALKAADETILPGVSLDKEVQKEIKDTILVHMFRD